MRSEPAVIIGALESLVIAAITFAAVLFEADAELTAAVVGLGSAAVAVVGAIITRSRVTPYVEGEE